MAKQPKTPDEQVRHICLALPETSEKEAWDQPTFRVRNKMFATIGHGAGAWIPDQPNHPKPTSTTPTGIVLKTSPDEREALLATGLPNYSPKYMGSKGWLGVLIDPKTNWDQIHELIHDSYRLIAPKKLSKLIS